MDYIKILVNFIFSIALFINGTLFLPQAFKILKLKNAKDLSLITFIGFLATQLAAILYGLLNKITLILRLSLLFHYV